MHTFIGNRTVPVLSLRDALARRGFPLETLEVSDYVRSRADEILVAFDEGAKVHFNKGAPWSFCSGAVLFSFCEVARYRGASDGACYTLAAGHAIVADVVGGDVRLKLVQPA